MSEVSVIIATHDRWTLLSRALRCALAQLDVAVEVIVVDDGSTTPPPPDPVWTDPRVRMIRQATNQGYVAARNAGAEASKGEWLAWLDDDDLWAPSKLARQLAAARTDGAVLAYAAAAVVDERLRPLETWPAPPVDDLAKELVRDVLIPAGGSNVIARRAAVIACGGFDNSFDHLADWDMWLRLARQGPAARCEQPLLAYVLHDKNMHRNAAAALMEEFDRLVDKHAAWAATMGVSFNRSWFSRYPTRLLVSRGRRREAFAMVARYCLRRPTPANVRLAISALAGDGFARRYRRFRGRDDLAPSSPQWLAEIARATTDRFVAACEIGSENSP